jgi:hypothetical protein
MAPDPFDEHVLSRVEMSRRDLVRRLVVGTAFAFPVVASFDMATLSDASADPLCTNQNPINCNQTCPVFDQTLTGDVPGGSLVIHSGQQVLINYAHVGGSLTVLPGGSVDIRFSHIGGQLNARNAGFVKAHSSKIGGPINVTGTRLVEFGGVDFCVPTTGGNDIGGNTSLTNNGVVAFAHNDVGGSLTIVGNQEVLFGTGNTVHGKSQVQQ